MPLDSIGTPLLWGLTIAAVALLIVADFLLTRRPHEVSMREAIGWSVFYIAIPVAFGVWVWLQHGSEIGLQYYTGYVVEKTLSVDNLFVFMLLLAGFAVPRPLQQRVLLFGVVGAIVLRGLFIAIGAQLISTFSWTFLAFGIILVLTGVKLLKDALAGGGHDLAVAELRSVRLLRRFMPISTDYHGSRLLLKQGEPGAAAASRWTLTPLAVVVIAILATDVVFAVDSVPAVYGITGDPFLVFATNAFALLGLRALYFVLEGALSKLAHLGFGLAVILGFIGVKLMLHWGHTVWPWVPEVPTLWSLGVIVAVLAVTVATSLWSTRSR